MPAGSALAEAATEATKEEADEGGDVMMTPREIVDHLNRNIVGQVQNGDLTIHASVNSILDSILLCHPFSFLRLDEFQVISRQIKLQS